MSPDPQWSIGVDTGGTFTDFVAVRPDGTLATHKVPSTPADPAQAVLDGLRVLLGDRDETVGVVHGSTVATNALLERRGAATVLVTTAGFEDLLRLGRQNRRKLYALRVEALRPPVVGSVGVRERMAYDGTVIEPLEDLSRLADDIRELGAESVAVCLLHAYANADHERRVAKALAELDIPVSLSSEVLPEYREYERASTTAVNAYVAPRMSAYLHRMGEAIESVGGSELQIMQSNGGVARAAAVARRPVATVLSGPAGGVVGALASAKRAGFERILSFDMGGTSTDVALCEGEVVTTSEGEVAGLPVRVPQVDLHTVGAGGGSIARLDAGGALRVGPESAGADPGPACYGRGSDPTVTDANLVLGRIDPVRFLGGRMPLDVQAARTAVGRLAQPMGSSLEDAALGIVRVANAAMVKALRVISVERGHDARDFALLSFGGAGGLHACELAAALDMRTVLVPPACGVLSAQGLLEADVVKDYARTWLGGMDDDAVSAAFDQLEKIAREEMARESGGHVELERRVDVRHAGQSFEVTVDYGKDWAERFHARYQKRYGYRVEAAELELVTLRLRARRRRPGLVQPRVVAASGPDPAEARVDTSDDEGIARFERSLLRGGHRVPSESVIVEDHATTWIPSPWTAEVHESGTLIIRREGGAS